MPARWQWLLHTLRDRGWLRRRTGERSLLITAEGRRRLAHWMPLPDPAARSPA